MELSVIMAGIEAAIAAAPKVIAVAEAGKNLITELFKAGAITTDTQNQLHGRVDVVMEAYLAGEIPPELTIEPDPVSAAPASQSTGEAAPATDAAPKTDEPASGNQVGGS